MCFVSLANDGGFCNVPGECICRHGYAGALCDVGEFYSYTSYFHSENKHLYVVHKSSPIPILHMSILQTNVCILCITTHIYT